MLLYSVLVLSVVFGDITALDNGLALTPPMGWMHWERFRCIIDCQNYPDECISDELFRTMADRLSSEGYLEAGYEYLMIDDCWAMKERNQTTGRLQPDPERFPDGIKPLADYIHSKGLKFGMYADYGNLTCAGYPGSIDHLELDAKTFAEWDVDYLKLDACYSDIDDLENGYRLMGEYLNKTGRPIVYSCSWPAYQEPLDVPSNYTALSDTCNLWRNWDDIQDAWTSVTSILQWFSKNQNRIAHFAGTGHWNDPDMLIIGNYGLSYEQSKAQMAIWSIMAAPLIMSVDLRTIETKFKDILLNKNAIKINQDPLGIQGKLIKTIDKIDLWTKPITPIVEGANSYAIGFLSNRMDGYPFRLNVTLSDLNITEAATYSIQDIFQGEIKEDPWILAPTDQLVVRVKPSGVVFLKVTPSEEQRNAIVDVSSI